METPQNRHAGLRALIVYFSAYGQTSKVAFRLGETLSSAGFDVSFAPLTDKRTPPLEGFDAVLVGGPVYVGRHSPRVKEFVDAHVDSLKARRVQGFFSVSLAAANPDGTEVAGLVSKFLDECGWKPEHVGQFAGAVRFSQYGWVKRLVMKAIVRSKGLEVEKGKDKEFTDWGKVDEFAQEIVVAVEAKR